MSLRSSGLRLLINLFEGYGQRKAETSCRVRVSQWNPRATVARSSGLGIGRRRCPP